MPAPLEALSAENARAPQPTPGNITRSVPETDIDGLRAKWDALPRGDKAGALVIGAVVLTLTIIIVSTRGSEAPESTPPARAAQDAPTAEPAATERPSFPTTPNDFQPVWNAFIADAAPELVLPIPSIEAGEVQDIWQHEFSEEHSMQLAMNKATGAINDVLILGRSTDAEEATSILLSWTALIATLNPELPAEGRGQVLRDLGLIGVDDLSGVDESTVRGGVLYHVQVAESLGTLFFTATPTS